MFDTNAAFVGGHMVVVSGWLALLGGFYLRRVRVALIAYAGCVAPMLFAVIYAACLIPMLDKPATSPPAFSASSSA